MNNKVWIVPVLIAHLLGPAAAAAVGAADVIVVNGESISNTSLDLLIEARVDHGVPVTNELQESMRDELVTRMVLAQQAIKRGLDENERIQAQNRLNELAVLSQAYLRDYAEGVEVLEAEQRAAYEEYLKNYDPKEYRVRQILVRNEVTAKELIARLEEGEDFATLASEHSIDPGADQNGGDLGWFRPDIFVDQRLSQAVINLSKGEYTRQPVHSGFGWHVVRVEDGPRSVKLPTYEELSEKWKEKMREQVVMRKVQEHVQELTKSAHVSGKSVTDKHAAR